MYPDLRNTVKKDEYSVFMEDRLAQICDSVSTANNNNSAKTARPANCNGAVRIDSCWSENPKIQFADPDLFLNLKENTTIQIQAVILKSFCCTTVVSF